MENKLHIVAGPGHTLNELTSRLIYNANHITHVEMWELYPGPFGLYARHSDDYSFNYTMPQLMPFYNDRIRNNKREKNYRFDDADGIEFKKMLLEYNKDSLSFYINTFALDLVQETFNDIASSFTTTILSLEKSKHRHHHLLMEYSTGAADSRDYSYIPDRVELCGRLVAKNSKEKEFIKTVPKEYNIVDIDEVLEGNYDVISPYIPSSREDALRVVKKTVEKYLFVNQCAHPVLQEINEMTWQEVVDESNKKIYNNRN